jgi:hypothetical protein
MGWQMKDQGRAKTYLGESTEDLRGQEGQNRGLEEHGDEMGRTVRNREDRGGDEEERKKKGCVKGGDGEKKVVLGGDNLASARKWALNGVEEAMD